MSVTANLNLLLTIEETFNADDLVNQVITHTGYSLVGTTLNATSTPPVTMVSCKDYSLSSGTKTIDLTALAGINGASQDATGLSVRALVLINPAGNHTLTLATGGTNGYDIDTLKVRAHATVASRKVCVETFGAVDGTHKNITITGTGSESFSLGLLLG